MFSKKLKKIKNRGVVTRSVSEESTNGSLAYASGSYRAPTPRANKNRRSLLEPAASIRVNLYTWVALTNLSSGLSVVCAINARSP